jgi:predicted dehydrogenase
VSQKIKWGVIGSGGIARRRTIPEGIVPAANAVLSVVFDVNARANAEVARQFHARAAGSIEELLHADVDAVYIATPAHRHRDQVCQAAAARKHVLCEKPLGLTVADAEVMLQACAEAGVRLGTALMMRFHAQHRAALQMLREGRLGRPVFARAQLSCWYPPMPGNWRQDPATGGGGALMDLGGHCLDLLEMFFGPARAVSCFTNRTVHAYAAEDSALTSVFFENGALGTVDTFFCIPDESSRNVLELYGSQGSIHAQGTIGQGDRGEMFARLQQRAGYDAQQSRSAGADLPINPPPVNTYRAEIEEFSQAILEQRPPANDGQIGLRSQQLLAACYASARTGCVVQVT